MATFLLIDHSLRTLGGHPYAYARNVLAAAERAGWQPALATHRGFRDAAAFPAHWRVHALFRHASYSRYTLDIQSRPGDATRRAAGWWQRLRDRFASRARARLTTRFAADCQALFVREPVGAGDLVFCATTSELDLGGLAAYLATRAPQAGLAWHMQFHFGLFGGRDPGYGAQLPGTAVLRAMFAAAAASTQGHALHFHCTTPQLATQYSLLGVGRFDALPYPVSEQFAPRPAPVAAGVVRVACLGHSRREKGYGALPLILRSLWREWFATGRAQLLLQTHRGRQRHALESLVARLAGDAKQPASAMAGASALEFAPFPLPLEGYTELVRGADLGLLLYDPTRYYARCSGVLLEMQCAGVPVLVPAGSWLAGQVEPLNQQWLDECAATLGPLQAAGDGANLDVPPGARSLLLSFGWEAPAAPGRYLRVRAASGGRVVATRILGARAGAQSVRMVLAVPAGTTRLALQLDAAWEPGAAAPARLLGWQESAGSLPWGRVGLTLAAEEELPGCLEELLAQHAHYRAGAREQAAACGQLHSAARVVEALLAATISAGQPVAGRERN